MLVEEVINLLIKGNPRSQFAITVKKKRNPYLSLFHFGFYRTARTYVRIYSQV